MAAVDKDAWGDTRFREGKGKDHDGDGDIDGDDYMAAKDKAIKKAMNKEAHDADHDEENEDKDVQEEDLMGNLKFSAEDRVNPEQLVFDAVLGWMKADTEGLVTPEDYEGYSMSTAFDDAKEFIRDVLQDISFSEVKSHLTGSMSLGDPEEAAFQASVDDDIRRDDSRLSDMPPRDPGV